MDSSYPEMSLSDGGNMNQPNGLLNSPQNAFNRLQDQVSKESHRVISEWLGQLPLRFNLISREPLTDDIKETKGV